jgi:hypothetical protein
MIRNCKFFAYFELAASQAYRDSRKNECKRSFAVMRMDRNLSLELLFVSGTTKPTRHGIPRPTWKSYPKLIVTRINN